MTEQVLLFPFRQAPAEAVTEPTWFVAGVPIADADLSAIDNTTVLDLSCSVAVDVKAVCKALGRGSYELELLLSVRADASGLQFVLAKQPVSSSHATRLQGNVAVDLLGDTATLRIDLFCAKADPAPGNELAPSHVGASLWSAVAPLRLFGIGSRFPMRAVVFGEQPLFPNACWHLEVDSTDPNASVMSTVQLSINAERTDIAAFLKGESAATPEARFINDQLKLDIARRLVAVSCELLTQDSAEERAGYPFDSVGALAVRIAERVRKRGLLGSLEELAELSRDHPAALDTLLQAVFVSRDDA